WINFPSTSGIYDFFGLLGSSVEDEFRIRNGLLEINEWGGSSIINVTAPSINTWHHVVYTYDGLTNSIYIDGSLITTDTTSPQTGGTSSVIFGNYATNGNEWYDGDIDDAR